MCCVESTATPFLSIWHLRSISLVALLQIDHSVESADPTQHLLIFGSSSLRYNLRPVHDSITGALALYVYWSIFYFHQPVLIWSISLCFGIWYSSSILRYSRLLTLLPYRQLCSQADGLRSRTPSTSSPHQSAYLFRSLPHVHTVLRRSQPPTVLFEAVCILAFSTSGMEILATTSALIRTSLQTQLDFCIHWASFGTQLSFPWNCWKEPYLPVEL